MLTLVTFLPLAVAAVLLAVPDTVPRRVFLWSWVATAGADLALTVALWARFDPAGGIQFEQRARWIPGAGVGYHVGVDGLSLPLIGLTCVLFLAVAVYSLHHRGRVKSYVLVFLFLQTVCVGLFAALDLIVFFVFFDLSIVGMYFVIAVWGHGEHARASALTFFLYTFLGSLALLLAFIGLYLAVDPHTFDIVDLTRADPLAGRTGYAALVLLALGIGLAVKTPTVPFHTWLPPAHTDAPAAGSAILAGVLLKMGTYGFLRIAMPMLPDAWRRFATVFVVIGVVSVVYGALVAFAQSNLKRMVAYTSVNHMGYILLAVGAAGILGGGDEQARSLAVTGAVTQMVSHGLITGALFLLCGVLYERGRTYDMAAYSGLARPMPVFAAATGVAAFASLGLPGFSGFIAEFQILTGALGPAAVATGIAVLGLLLTAALFLNALQRVLTGPERVPDGGGGGLFPDMRAAESWAILPLLAFTVLIGVAPRVILDVIEPASRTVVQMVAR